MGLRDGKVREHLSSAEIALYCQPNDVPRTLIRKVEQHISDCGECSRLVVETVRREVIESNFPEA